MTEIRHTIGTDPEFFLEREDGKLISAVGIISGTKMKPETMDCGSALQFDNVAVEFATPTAKSAEEMVDHIRNTFTELMTKIPKGHNIVAKPSAIFDTDQLQTEEALLFGCEPDFDAWKVQENEKPQATNANFRSCGGHLHVGHVPGDGTEFLLQPFGKIHAVRMMDAFHGIASTLLDSSVEAIARRELYGKAGCHRPTNYGVEYRTLSNFWMKSPQLVMLVDSFTTDVLNYLRSCCYEDITSIAPGPELIQEIGESELPRIINLGDVSAAEKVLNGFVRNYMSEDSLKYLEYCREKITDFDLVQEWTVGQ